MLIQGLCNASEQFDESPVMSYQAQKVSNFSVDLGWSKFCHSFQVLFTGLYAFLADMMSQIVNLTLKELTLCWLELQMVLSEVIEHNVQVM